MCGSMVDIQSRTAEIRRGKKKKKMTEKPQGKNMSASATQGGHKKQTATSQMLQYFQLNIVKSKVVRIFLKTSLSTHALGLKYMTHKPQRLPNPRLSHNEF